MLTRYWFEFDDDNLLPQVKIGCGVTAFTYEDALNLIRKKIFEDAALPEIRIVIENIDVSILDTGHILPNMNPPNFRGIWFPRGYDY